MVKRKRAEELARKYLFGQQQLFPQDFSTLTHEIHTIQEVLLDLGPDCQAFLLVYPDETVELLYFGEHDDYDVD